MSLENNFEALLIREGNMGQYDAEEILPKNGIHFTLEELQEYVGGYIEIVRCLNPEYIAIIDEEGKLKGREVNGLATWLVHTALSENDYLVGNVIFCKSKYVV